MKNKNGVKHNAKGEIKHMDKSKVKYENESKVENKSDKKGVKKSKKKKVIAIFITAILAFVVALIIYIFFVNDAYGYFTYKALKQNSINLGYNKIVMNENYVPPLNIEKGVSFTKEPYVTNIGNVDCYVRIKSVVSDSRVAEYLSIDYNKEDFTYNADDGYWYYNKIVKPGERTESLFTTVSIAEDADDVVLDGFDIYVYAESVQSVDGLSMDEVWNYFES